MQTSTFLDAIASPGPYPCQWVGQWVSGSVIKSFRFGDSYRISELCELVFCVICVFCTAYTQMAQSLTTIKVQYSVHSHTHLGSTASKCFCDTDSALTVNINIISELQIASLLLRSELFHSIEMRFVLMGVSGSGLSLPSYFHKKMGVSSGSELP